MDLILEAHDYYFFTPYVYPSTWPENSMTRQALSIYAIAMSGSIMMYISMATLSYYFLYDHRLMRHPLFIPGQVRLEIKSAMKSLPVLSLMTIPHFLLEVRGYTKLYMGISGVWGWAFLALSVVTAIMFSDCLIYWIHRGLHHRLIYKYVHKEHHTWKVPTPFASHALHPLDAYLQGLPYFIYPFLFPEHKVVYLLLYVVANTWSLSIHDGDYRVPDAFKPIINGSAHHTDHHLFYNYNYGHFFTLWDRIGGSFRYPSAYEGNLLLKEIESEKAKGS